MGRGVSASSKKARSVPVRDLKGSREHSLLQSVLDIIPDQVFMKDEALRYVLVNRSFCQLLHRKQEDILGKLDRDILKNEEAKRLKKTDLEALKTGLPIELSDSAVTDATEATHRIHYRAQRLDDIKNGKRLLACVIRELTEDRQGKGETKNNKHELERMVEHMFTTTRNLMQRNEETSMMNISISGKLLEKISQIDNISRLREALRKSPDVGSGLNQILSTAMKDLGMDSGAVFVVDVKKKTAVLRASQSKIGESQLEENYPLDEELLEFKTIRENNSISVIVREKNESILGLSSIHCAPIHYEGSIYGILALASQKEITLDSSDLAILSLYSELASAVFKEQRLTVEPVREQIRSEKRKYELRFGRMYVVANDIDKAFEVFADNVLTGLDGLCITRRFPPEVRKDWGLQKTPIVWLTEEKLEDFDVVYSLEDLSILIASFLSNVTRGIVLLDGFEYLVTNHSFEAFIRFLQRTRSRFERNECILVAPLLEQALDTRETRLIEREMTTINL